MTGRAGPRVDVGWHLGTAPPFRTMRVMARVGRMLGADSLWVVDHLTGWFPKDLWTPELTWLGRGPGRDAYFEWQTAIGAMAPVAGRARLAVGVTEPIRRHPVVLAQAALTLSHLTRRPPILGIGAGEAENVVPYGLPFDRPVSRLAEALEVIRLCLDADGPVDFEGAFFRLEHATFDLRPGAGGRPEVWVAAHGPRMLELTGRFGDGWYPTFPMRPEEYAASLGSVRSAAVAAGRDPDGITPSFQAFCVPAPTDELARRWLEHPAVRFMALLAPDAAWRSAGLVHPLGAGFRGVVDFVPGAQPAELLWDAIGRVPADLMAEQTIWGSPATIVSRLRGLAEAGMRHVVLAPVSPLVSRRALLHTVRLLPGIVRRLRTGT